LEISAFVNKNPAFDQNNYNLNKKVTQEIETPKYKVLITYLNANGKIKNNKKVLDSYNIKVLVKIKN